MQWIYDISNIPKNVPLLLHIANEEPSVGCIVGEEIISADNAYDMVNIKHIECYCIIPEYGTE